MRYLFSLRIFLFILSLGLFYITDAFAETAPLASPPTPTILQPTINPVTPNLDAKAYILLDADSGKILAEKNSDTHLPPASLTKLMTMYVISSAIKSGTIHADDLVQISEKAWKTGGSRMFVKVNDKVPVKDLLRGIVIASGNDAAVAMAEYIAGTEGAFADLMNAHAKKLGMNDSHFVDSNGLPDPNHYSSAHDLGILTRAIINEFPEDYKLYSEKWFTWNNIRQPNRNRLLWHFPEADGLKTGHTSEAGFCLVGSAKKNDMRLISVVMGEKSDAARTEDSVRLLTYGFRFFQTQKLYPKNQALMNVRVWKGKNKTLELGLADDLYLTLPASQFKNLQIKLTQDHQLTAPIQKNQAYGSLVISFNNQVIAKRPLVALTDDPHGNLWRSMADAMHFHIRKLFSHFDEKMSNA